MNSALLLVFMTLSPEAGQTLVKFEVEVYFLPANNAEADQSVLNTMCRFVSDWVYSGVFRDVYKEFLIQVNEDYLSYRGERACLERNVSLFNYSKCIQRKC